MGGGCADARGQPSSHDAEGTFGERDTCNTTAHACRLYAELTCSRDADCGRCVLHQPGACVDDAECPTGSACAAALVVATTAATDEDDDGVPDGQDNCLFTPNTDQKDGDSDWYHNCPQAFKAAQRQRLAVGVSGGGLTGPETMVFPPWCGVVACDGTSPAGGHLAFLRIGTSDRFRVRLTLHQRDIAAPLASAPETVRLSLGGVDRQATTHACRVAGRGTRATCR